MRSVFAFIKESDKNQIVDLLDSICLTNVKDVQWIYGSMDNPILYIGFDNEKSLINGLEAEDQSILEILDELDLYMILVIDISGRHPGENEVFYVLKSLFSKFKGYVMDDYSEHLWTIDEIANENKYMNHKFFDYKGWYEEDKLFEGLGHQS